MWLLFYNMSFFCVLSGLMYLIILYDLMVSLWFWHQQSCFRHQILLRDVKGAIERTGVHTSNGRQVSMMQNRQLQRESALHAVKATDQPKSLPYTFSGLSLSQNVDFQITQNETYCSGELMSSSRFLLQLDLSGRVRHLFLTEKTQHGQWWSVFISEDEWL